MIKVARRRAARSLLASLWSRAAACRRILSSPLSYAKEEPLWEFGLGAGAIAFEDYRGSDTTHAYPLPVPYIVYNGKFLKADRDGVRGTLFNQDWFEINLSFNLTTPVQQRSRAQRHAGPAFHGGGWDPPLISTCFAATIARSNSTCACRCAPRRRSNPRRASSVGHSRPRLNLDLADPFGLPGWNLGLLAGPLFADRRYHDYFYSVAPQYATPTRPEFQAAGRLCRHADSGGPVEALSQILGGRLHALRHAGRRGVC